MKRVMVRYRVRVDRAEENRALVQRVFEELDRTRPDHIRYASFVESDGVSFVHIASIESESGHNPLMDVSAFRSFQERIKERCEEAPVVVELIEVGNYRLFGTAMGG